MTNELLTRENMATPWTDLDRALADLHAHFLGAWDAGASGPIFRAARTDLEDTGTAYRLTAEVPGIPKEKLDIRVRGTTVEIRGEQAEATEAKSTDYLHRERRYAGYYRLVQLPEAVVAKSATAKVENGVLELTLPKETPTPQDGEVKVPVP